VVAFQVSEESAARLRKQAYTRSQTRPKGSRRDVRVGKNTHGQVKMGGISAP